MYKRLLISPLAPGLAGILCGLTLPSALQAQTNQVGPGFNGFDTQTMGSSVTTFDGMPFEGVPLGTFNFGGSIGVQNVGNTDTIVQRMGPPVTAPGGTMPLDVVAFQLESVNQVSGPGGLVGNLFLTLDTSAQNTGLLTIDSFPNLTTGSPGTFNDYFTVNFDVTFGSPAGTPVEPEQSLTMYASGDWGPMVPPDAIPIAHNPEGPGDWHYVSVDPGITPEEYDPDSSISGDVAFQPFGLPVPETSSTFALLGLVTLSLLACDWRRRTAKA